MGLKLYFFKIKILFLLKIILFMVLYCFDVLILKIIFKK